MSLVKMSALGAVLAMLRKVEDPLERLTAIRAVRAEVKDADDQFDRLARGAIHELRQRGWTWKQIGDELAVSPQRAHQLGTGPTPTERREA